MSPLASRVLVVPSGGEGSISIPPCWFAGSYATGGAITSITNLGRGLVVAPAGGGSLLPRDAGEIVNGEVVVRGTPGATAVLYFDF